MSTREFQNTKVTKRKGWKPSDVPPAARTYLVHLLATQEYTHVQMIELCFEIIGYKISPRQFERFARITIKEVAMVREMLEDKLIPTPENLIERSENLIHKILKRTTEDYKIHATASKQFASGYMTESEYKAATAHLYLLPVSDLLKIRSQLKKSKATKPRGRPKKEKPQEPPRDETTQAPQLSEDDQKKLNAAIAAGDTIEMQRLLHANKSARTTVTRS